MIYKFKCPKCGGEHISHVQLIRHNINNIEGFDVDNGLVNPIFVNKETDRKKFEDIFVCDNCGFLWKSLQEMLSSGVISTEDKEEYQSEVTKKLIEDDILSFRRVLENIAEAYEPSYYSNISNVEDDINSCFSNINNNITQFQY